MAKLSDIGGLSATGGLAIGKRLNLSGNTPSGTKSSSSPKTPARAKPSPSKTKPTMLAAAQAAVTLPVTTKLAAFVRPEITKNLDPSILTFRPEILTAFLEKTTTQLARGAITQLKSINSSQRDEAITTIQNRGIRPDQLMNHLERRVKIGEVLNQMAEEWVDETPQDFAEALNMDINKQAIMDTIVSLAILNDPDLDDELRVENLSEPTEDELLSNRRIVWQYPPPGTPLDPPYMVFVAVEHQEFTEAQEVIDSILGQLVTHQGFKVPKIAVPRPRVPLRPTISARQPITRS